MTFELRAISTKRPDDNVERTAGMIVIIVSAAIALFAGVGYWWWSRRSLQRGTVAQTVRAPKPFASVEIRPGGGACEAARALKGKRFLSTQAPALPLSGCTATRCGCNFVKLSDRRTDDRRFGHHGLKAALFLNAERRKPTDRRGD
jgi:hypothetical protein